MKNLLALLWIVPAAVLSQTPSNAFVHYSGILNANDIISTRDRGYLIGGDIQYSSYGFNKIKLIKLNYQLFIEWSLEIGHCQGCSESVYDVEEINPGGYITSGYLSDWTFASIYTETKLYVVRLDSTGNILWNMAYYPDSMRIPFDNAVFQANVFKIQPLLNGDFILACTVKHMRLPQPTMLLVVRIDPNGNPIWSKTYDSYIPNSNYVLKDICSWKEEQTEKGVYLTATFMDDSVNASRPSIALLKIDLNGNLLWEKVYGHSQKYMLSSIVRQTPEGDVLLSGRITGPNDFFIIKTDSAGNVLWNKRFGIPNHDLMAEDMVILPYNSYAVSGYMWGNGVNSAFLVKTDTAGNVIWGRRYKQSWSDCFVTCMDIADDSSFIMAGYRYGNSSDDTPVIKTDPTGHVNCHEFNMIISHLTDTVQTFSRFIQDTAILIAYTPFIVNTNPPISKNNYCVTYNTGLDEPDNAPHSIFPNPAAGICFIKSVNQIDRIEVFSLAGERIYELELPVGIQQVDLCHLNPGCYIYNLFSGDMPAGNGKLILEK